MTRASIVGLLGFRLPQHTSRSLSISVPSDWESLTSSGPAPAAEAPPIADGRAESAEARPPTCRSPATWNERASAAQIV